MLKSILINTKIKIGTLMLFSLMFSSNIFAQKDSSIKSSVTESRKDKKWYDNIAIRGYAQARYNRLFETNPDLTCEQCDKSWGNNGGFFLRRMRVILYGQVSKQVYVYIQPDLASSPSSDKLHFAQLRDAYFDVGVDADNRFRFRVGQSKVPFGF